MASSQPLNATRWRNAAGERQAAAAAQAGHVQAAEPATQFLRLLTAALASGRVHVAGPNGKEPDAPEVWGWRLRIIGGTDGRDDWQPQGKRIGWTDDDELYLEPEAAFAAAQELAREQGDGLPVSTRTLHKRLHERGLLASTDTEREVLTVRRTFEGRAAQRATPAIACLSAESPDQPDQKQADFEGNGQFGGQVSAIPTTNPTTKPDQNPAASGRRVGLVGSDDGVDAKPADNSQPQSKRLRGSL